MSLKVTNSTEVPKGCIQLTRDEALIYQWKQVKNWPERWDVWPYLYGIPALGFMAGLGGLKINNHYRLKLKLRRYGLGSTMFAMTLTPAIFSVTTHCLFVISDLFLNQNNCLLCLQTRAIGFQLLTSIIYPAVMSPSANFMFATRHGTYPLPYWKDYKNTLKLWFTMNKSLAPKMKIFIPLQILAAGFLTYMEAESLYNIRSKMENNEIEKLPEIDF
ncbi:hypothetical protein PV327_000568 [Microctonus hyperodae]|uniref:Uncharacterized protein n=1 Tax=Microctonus hyperodae TaxID=165561 RepID=A0AA39L2H7_MICHY|nr:hypothetical protein PV327_000568 [Microctonus hyperodae]